eukprot:4624709-Pleurochrysis_carterae.AAC.1
MPAAANLQTESDRALSPTNGPPVAGERALTGMKTVPSARLVATNNPPSLDHARLIHAPGWPLLSLTPDDIGERNRCSSLSALFAHNGGEIVFTTDAQGRALCLHSADAEPGSESDPFFSAPTDSLTRPVARDAPCNPASFGVMTQGGTGAGASCERRV